MRIVTIAKSRNETPNNELRSAECRRLDSTTDDHNRTTPEDRPFPTELIPKDGCRDATKETADVVQSHDLSKVCWVRVSDDVQKVRLSKQSANDTLLWSAISHSDLLSRYWQRRARTYLIVSEGKETARCR